jgi:ribonuclease T1
MPVNWTVWSSSVEPVRKLGLASILVAVTMVGAAVHAKGPLEGHASIALSALPNEAQQTQRSIRAGGPFPYAKDGIVFGNRERALPRRERGYYHEYTVPTPGSRDRGARRIVCGGSQLRNPEACFFTDDHYATFRFIAE